MEKSAAYSGSLSLIQVHYVQYSTYNETEHGRPAAPNFLAWMSLRGHPCVTVYSTVVHVQSSRTKESRQHLTLQFRTRNHVKKIK